MEGPTPVGPMSFTPIAIDPYHPLLQRIHEDGTITAFPPSALVMVMMIADRIRHHHEPGYGHVLYPEFKGARGIGTQWVGILERTRPDRRAIALTVKELDLTTMPEDMFRLLLPMLLNFIPDKPSTTDLHALHVFIDEVPRLSVMAWEWLQNDLGAQYLKGHFRPSLVYPDFQTAYKDINMITFHRKASDLVCTSQKTLFYDSIMRSHCTYCISMAGRLGLCNTIGYDIYGRSALHAAIEAEIGAELTESEEGLILFLLDEILNAGVDPRHFPTSIDGLSIPHHVARTRDPQLFMAMTRKLSEKGFPLLLWNDDGLKLQLCSFASRYMAEWLWRYEKFNIAWLPRNTLPYHLPPDGDEIQGNSPFGHSFNRDAAYGDPIEHSFFSRRPSRGDFARAYVHDPDIPPRFGDRGPLLKNTAPAARPPGGLIITQVGDDENDEQSESEAIDHDDSHVSFSSRTTRTSSPNRSDHPDDSSDDEYSNNRRPPTSRTIWHRAIENPNGADILRWLNEHSDVAPTTRDNFNLNEKSDEDDDQQPRVGIKPLIAAVQGNQPATIKWFCDQEPHGMIPHSGAANYAASNLYSNCVQILDIVLSRLNKDAWRDAKQIKLIYWHIIIAYNNAHMHWFTELPRGPERNAKISLLREATRGKFRVLNRRMRPFWYTFRKSAEIHWLLQFGELQEDAWIRDRLLENEFNSAYQNDFSLGTQPWNAGHDQEPLDSR
ncbi:uncharacterized protein N7511_006657 [Penicillium nucicola]|uniref:uncharacterized protein n=1 Tax=Penicillium nucicola TaxID=1850975 RepID=UPI0025459963|nr:uncharacterized protein N7511_006657 [Penicillium nucicola]KAJ5757963.1 hypothetical protein N7511_006657 [Penicillium nucicola]